MKKPAEIHFREVDAVVRAESVQRDGEWLVVWEPGRTTPDYYPTDRIQHVHRLPPNDTVDSTDDAHEPDTDDTDDDDREHNSGARDQAREILAALGIDPGHVKTMHKNQGIEFESREDLETGEGSAWRQFTNDWFSPDDEKPGDMDFFSPDGYDGMVPTDFFLDYSALDDVYWEVVEDD
jgi:hypothetical protein